MVYVISKDGQSLMPTERHGKVRRLLRDKKAKVVRRCPFTIQLLYDTTTVVQEVTLGVDAGSKAIGLSATTRKKVLFEAEVALRNDIVDLLSTRREMRRGRRNRKTRYRKARFNNRKKGDGWLAPSVRQKIESHINIIGKLHQILPIRKVVVEVASFDIQKIKNLNIQGEEYQQGEQLNFWNVREYVLFRDGHTCQCCKGKSKDKVLNIHHIESRKTGGNAPNNLITLCKTCHTNYHKGVISLPKKIHRRMKFNDATFMGIMRWCLYNTLKEIYPDVKVTYGYITKHTRIQHGLQKTHYVDARCISKNAEAVSDGNVFYMRKVRCHNRQIHKMTTNKGNYRKLNQSPYILNGYRLFDKVIYNGKIGFVSARRRNGSYRVRDIFWNSISEGVTFRKLKFVESRQYYLCDKLKVS
jgi:N6-L-threonylcarbamoyladenine synthase